jgi:hypothetical protein
VGMGGPGSVKEKRVGVMARFFNLMAKLKYLIYKNLVIKQNIMVIL